MCKNVKEVPIFRTVPITRHINISAVKCLHFLASDVNKIYLLSPSKFMVNLRGGDDYQGFVGLEITAK